MKKKILFFGPIGDFGGRDIEVNIIAKAIKDEYQVEVLSSIYITKNSYALQGLDIEFSSFEKSIYESNWYLRFVANLFYLKNKKSKRPYAYIKNDLSNLFFDFEKAFFRSELKCRTKFRKKNGPESRKENSDLLKLLQDFRVFGFC